MKIQLSNANATVVKLRKLHSNQNTNFKLMLIHTYVVIFLPYFSGVSNAINNVNSVIAPALVKSVS